MQILVTSNFSAAKNNYILNMIFGTIIFLYEWNGGLNLCHVIPQQDQPQCSEAELLYQYDFPEKDEKTNNECSLS